MLNSYRFHSGQFSINFQILELIGTEVASFLQKQSTFDVNSIPNQHFQLISFLDPQGRMECYGWLLKDLATYYFLSPLNIFDQTVSRLEKFLISEDVEIQNRGIQSWTFLIGPQSFSEKNDESFQGLCFEEQAYLSRHKINSVPEIAQGERELWRKLNGWPSFEGEDFKHEFINNHRLYDLSLSLKKGCYPGQETVSKIANGRGAALSPVLIKTSSPQQAGDLWLMDKKVGEVSECLEWNGSYYLAARLLRDFRVLDMQINLVLNQRNVSGTVQYYPLLSGSQIKKAQDMYDQAMEYFKQDDLNHAEESFRLSLKLDPRMADAYESLGVMLGRESRYQEAIELMDQLIVVDPKSVLAHTNKSLYLMKMGKIQEAEEEKSLATIKSFQKFGEEAKLQTLKDEQIKRQELEWAQRESMFKQVLEIDPEDTLANYGIGSIAVEKKQWAEAIAHLEKVIEQDAKYSVAYLALGKAYLGAGKRDKARSIWTKGIEIAAKNGDFMPANSMQTELSDLT